MTIVVVFDIMAAGSTMLLMIADSAYWTVYSCSLSPVRSEQEWWSRKKKREACISIRTKLKRPLFHIPINKCQTKGQSFCSVCKRWWGILKKWTDFFHSATMPAFAGLHAFQTAEILLSRRTAAREVEGEWNDGEVGVITGCSFSQSSWTDLQDKGIDTNLTPDKMQFLLAYDALRIRRNWSAFRINLFKPRHQPA